MLGELSVLDAEEVIEGSRLVVEGPLGLGEHELAIGDDAVALLDDRSPDASLDCLAEAANPVRYHGVVLDELVTFEKPGEPLDKSAAALCPA